MHKEGLVVGSNDGMVKVAVQRTSTCGGDDCKTCSGCDTPEVFVDLPNTVRAEVGDKVRIKANTSKVFFFSLFIYVVPIIFLVAGILISYSLLVDSQINHVELISFAFGLLCFGLSAIILKIVDNKAGNDDSSLMVIDKVIGSIVD